MKLKCQRCKHEWDYQGLQLYYTNCPRCMVKVRLKWNDEQFKFILDSKGEGDELSQGSKTSI